MLPVDEHSPEAATRGGFSMLEVLVLGTILVMGLMALTSTAMTVHRLRRSNEERQVAGNALESIVAEVRRSAQVARTGDEPWGRAVVETYAAGGPVGDELEVRGLRARDGAAGVLRIELVTDETLTDAELGVELGLPVDLDGDGVIASTDVRDTAELLPVVVRLEWTGAAGDAGLRQSFFVTRF